MHGPKNIKLKITFVSRRKHTAPAPQPSLV